MSALLHAHKQLLAKIALKKKELQRLAARVDTVMMEAGRRMQPVVAEIEELDLQCHQLFAELFSRQRQSRRTITGIKGIYRMLQDLGVLSPRHPPAEDSFGGGKKGARPVDNAGQTEPPPRPREGGGFSARRPSDGTAAQSLRGLFRRLATVLHPDKVQQEEEKARLTEVMKELTQAYQDGDLARLIELERIWAAGADITPQSDELGRRCATLAQTNEELRVQLDQILRELKDLRRSPPAELLKDFDRAARHGAKEPIEAMVEEAKEHFERLRELHGFVGAFRDGKLALEEFLDGPPSLRGVPEDFDDMLDSLFDLTSAAQSKRRQRGKRRGAGRVPNLDDIPF
jgi:hypothetical protein